MVDKKNPYHEIDNETEIRIQKIIAGDFSQAALGTITGDSYPMVTKIIPMFYKKSIYLLLSDLSEHTKNIKIESKVSIYYALKEKHPSRSNNPRLTLQGNLKKLEQKKDQLEFVELLKEYSKVEPGAKMWGLFLDFNFYKFAQNRQLYVEGFAKAYEKNS